MSGPSSFDDAPAGLERVTDALRRMPAVDPRAIDRTVAAALARRRVRQSRRAWLARAAGLALAVGLAGGGVWVGRRGAPTATSETATTPTATDLTATLPTATAARAPSTGGPARLAGMGRGEDAPVAVAFALRHPGARRVSLVGDFDVWSPTAAPMRRLPDGTWTTTVALAPGRHAYAFVVDDSVWVTDPTAPLVHDPDYGRDHSVIVVGQP